MTCVLVTGAGGQLGQALQAECPADVNLVALTAAQLDITDAEAVIRALEVHRPEAVINAAAYTAVDRAEQEPERAEAINGQGVAHLAAACDRIGARLLQVSTDFVFDGNRGRPCRPDDPTVPLNAYGRSKLAGERAAAAMDPEQYLIMRTAWLYAPGGQNFVTTMLRLMSERDRLAVVCDQFGTPTSARGLARALWRALERRLQGVHHWTDAGVASWYDFAVAIHELGRAQGLLTRNVRIDPIPASDYPTPATRPGFAVLEKNQTWAALDIPPQHWRSALDEALAQWPRS
ncbi:MAG: dTDP-4-dehydrorhamnose reductase [Halothiobacillaceae bacterium]